MLSKILVQDYHHTAGLFTCVCFDPSLGDDTPDRIVTEAELCAYLDAPSLDLIPAEIECSDAEAGTVTHRQILSLDEWMECNDLHIELSAVINAKEGRKGQLPMKPFPLADFLFPAGILSLNKTAA